MELFLDSFLVVGRALLRIFFLGLAGFFLSRFGWISEEGFDEVSKIVIYFTLPALIFSNFFGSSHLAEITTWWVYPLGMATVVGIGVILGLVVSRFLDWSERRQFGALLGFPNTGYLPLALAAALVAHVDQAKAFQLIFLFTLGMTPNLWSVGVALISGKIIGVWQFVKNTFSSPPFFAILISIGMVLLGWQDFVPSLVVDTASYAGEVTVPLIMIVLGGMLAKVDSDARSYPGAISILLFVKLVAYPVTALVAIFFFRPPELLAFVLLIEAATPPATNLAVIGKHYGSDTDLLNQGLVYSYLVSMFTIPVFISLLRLVYS
ncbi:AEC family transporter [Candidatus Bipolaricaulota bacterium]|nr:AEC family transporter [Candidatus Bipolaricaulota bacterium]